MNRKFSIPNPCGKSWNAMQPRENGRYCDSCCKVVVDFRERTNAEILQYLHEQPGERVCGIFRNSQLHKPRPGKRLLRFLASLLLAFGTTLFSCNNDAPQQQQQREDQHSHSTMGVMPAPAESLQGSPQLLKEKEHQQSPIITHEDTIPRTRTSRFTPPADDEVSLPPAANDTFAIQPPIPDPQPDLPVLGMIDDVAPEYPGGNAALRRFFADSVHLSQDEDVYGTVYIQFVIKADGSVDSVKLIRGVFPDLDRQMLKAARSMKGWKPAVRNGKPVSTKFILPLKVGWR